MCDVSSRRGVESLLIYFICSVGVKFRVNLYELPGAASQAKLKKKKNTVLVAHHGIRWYFDKRDKGDSCHMGKHKKLSGFMHKTATTFLCLSVVLYLNRCILHGHISIGASSELISCVLNFINFFHIFLLLWQLTLPSMTTCLDKINIIIFYFWQGTKGIFGDQCSPGINKHMMQRNILLFKVNKNPNYRSFTCSFCLFLCLSVDLVRQ